MVPQPYNVDGQLSHAQPTNATDYHLGHVLSTDTVCPEDAATAAMYARPAAYVPPPGPFPPGSWSPQPAAWVS